MVRGPETRRSFSVSRLLDDMALVLDPRGVRQNTQGRGRAFWGTEIEEEHRDGSFSRAWITLQFAGPQQLENSYARNERDSSSEFIHYYKI